MALVGIEKLSRLITIADFATLKNLAAVGAYADGTLAYVRAERAYYVLRGDNWTLQFTVGT